MAISGSGSAASRVAILVLAVILVAAGCKAPPPAAHPDVDRESRLPADVVKRTPETDRHPPILHSPDYEPPVPLPYPISTAGAEDCPVISPDGKTLYFFFTPDVRVPPEKQLLDSVTGTYVSYRTGDDWSKPERVWLNHPGELSLDSTLCVVGTEMWFCTARAGYEGVTMFTAELVDGSWSNWRYVGDRLMAELQVGEVWRHGDELYFHSDRAGGMGGLDIWVTTWEDGWWSDPVHLSAVNTTSSEGFPFVTADGSELWFTRTHKGSPALFRAPRLAGGSWGSPELIISQFAGGCTLDDAGNIYFCHHHFEDGQMIEADIYVAYRKDTP